MDNTKMFRSSSRRRSLFPHSASFYPSSDYNYSLFCLIAQSTSSIQSAGLFDPFDSGFCPPNYCFCPELVCVIFPHFSPSLSYVPVHVEEPVTCPLISVFCRKLIAYNDNAGLL